MCRMLLQLLFLVYTVIGCCKGFIRSYERQCMSLEKDNTLKGHFTAVSKRRRQDECIFHKMTERYRRELERGGSRGNDYKTSLNRVRPNTAFTIKLLSLTMRGYSIDEDRQTSNMFANLKMTWIDDRLSWKPERFNNVKVIRVFDGRYHRSMWTPKFGKGRSYNYNSIYGGSPKARKSLDALDPNNPSYGDTPTITDKSNVTLTYVIRLNSQEDIFDYSMYPFDRQKMCFPYEYNYGSPPTIGSVTIDTAGLIVRDSKGFRKRNRAYHQKHTWVFDKISTNRLDTNPGIEICMHVKRDATSKYHEVILPAVISVALAVLAPLFGTFRSQAFVKIVSLFAQYFCLIEFTSTTARKHIGNSLPKLLILQEMNMILTAISLVVTVALWTLARRPLVKPPSLVLTKITDIVERYFLCKMEAEADLGQTALDWFGVAQGLNGIAFVVFLVLYVIAFLAFIPTY